MSEAPESSAPGSTFGWPLVAALAITIALVVDRPKPFVHSRPSSTSSKANETRLQARLWHDPISKRTDIDSEEVVESKFRQVLVIMVPEGFRSQQIESRCNTRQALHTAASSLDFTPADAQVRQFLPVKPDRDAGPAQRAPVHHGCLDPAETAAASSHGAPAPDQKKPKEPPPIHCEVFQRGDPDNTERVLVIWWPDRSAPCRLTTALDGVKQESPIIIIGPSSTERIEELSALTKTLSNCGSNTVRVYSPWVTTNKKLPSPAKRFVCEDAQLARIMEAELIARGVELGPEVLLVLERDSEYARSWREYLSPIKSADGSHRLKTIYYSRGIDGELPRRTRSKEAREDDPPAIEQPRGQSTTDYFRRLRDRIAQQSHHERVRAVGVFGDDIHDKLLILQALRPALPDAIYFGSDLDAYLLSPDEQPHTRNLLVASGHDLAPRDCDDITPFRTSYQTSTYEAVHAALAGTPFDEIPQPPSPRVFEIANGAAVDVDKQVDWPTWWWSGLVLLLALLLCWATHGLIRTEPEKKTRRWPDRHIRAWFCWAVVAMTIFTWITMAASDEPLSWSLGISVWPTATFRLLGIGLSLVFSLKVIRAIHESIGKLGKEHGQTMIEELSGLVARATRRHRAPAPEPQRTKKRTTKRAKAPRGLPEVEHATATRNVTLHCFLIALTVVALGGVYVLVAGWPHPPTRGLWATIWDTILTIVALTALAWLVTLVVEFARLQARRCQALESQAKELLKAGQFTSKLDRLVTGGGRGIYGPFVVTLVLSIGRLDVFDRWTWSTLLIFFLIACTTAIILAHVVLHRSAMRLRNKAITILRDQLGGANPGDERLKFKHEQLTRMRHGILAGPANHPILVALLIPFSGMGGLSLIHMMQSPPF